MEIVCKQTTGSVEKVSRKNRAAYAAGITGLVDYTGEVIN
jgi:hypothetical protein